MPNYGKTVLIPLIRDFSPYMHHRRRRKRQLLIQEVILENFMSYEYARVQFKSGVNVVCGPNGSGKSSLLLAISVALGQSYTERSKKLSNLIRWGKDQSRVTLILDNRKKGTNRPVPKFNKDQIFLTRVLRKDGQYWFELENRAATKNDLERLLSKLGVEPDNILIIMHQNMVEQFTVLPPQEKLRMVEAAVGLEPYRENVLQAQKKLVRILSQEDSIGKLLENAEQTLNYWRGQYDRYQEKKQLQIKLRFLEREILWAEVARRESVLENFAVERKKMENILANIDQETEIAHNQLQDSHNELGRLGHEWKNIFDQRMELERAKARNESAITMCRQLLAETALIEKANPQISISRSLSNQLKLLNGENLRTLVEDSNVELRKINLEINDRQTKTASLEEATEKSRDQVLEDRVKLALLQYRKENAANEIKTFEKEIEKARVHTQEATTKAEQTGPRIAVVKNTSDILDEIRITEGHLAALADVSEDIERMYESYSKLYLELKDKAQLVAENREKTLEEVKTRMQAWRTVIQSLLNRVNLEYQKILSQTQAVGEVGTINEQDIEAAGLQILVGFKGGKPTPLDAYTQSGGERTTATMSFLLALQKHVRSPFRAVDEYDIHMDPKNRELIAKMLISTVRDGDSQYIIITPSQITFAVEDVNIITVQNIEGKSIIREVA